MDLSQPTPAGKSPRRRWIWAVAALAVLGGAYTVGWNVAASRVQGRLLAALAGQDANDLSVDCRQPETGGFPLSLSLHCASLAADDVQHGISMTLGAAEARVSLFSPNNVHSRLEGPAEIRSSKGMATSQWQALSSDVAFGLSGMKSMRVDATGLKASLADPVRGNALQLAAERFSSTADGANGDLAVAMTMEGATLARNDAALPLPPLKIDAAMTVTDRGGIVGRFDRQALYGAHGQIGRFAANLGEGRDIVVSGPFSVDDAGRISGKFQIEAKNVQAWLDAARQAAPEAENLIATAASLIRSYTKGNADLSIDLTLKRGKVLIAGFIPVGEIPPL